MNPNVKPWLILAVIFVAGGLSGAALTLALAPHWPHHPGAGQMHRRWMDRLTHELNLTADQQARIDPMVTDTETALQQAHHDEFEQIKKIFKDSDDKIAQLLTPDQKAKQQQMIAEREKLFSGHRGPFGPRHGGGPGDDNPPPPPPPPSGSPPPSGA